MSRKERLLVNTIDVEQEYKIIGLDLAKDDTSCVCIAESGEIIAIDRLSYADLLEAAECQKAFKNSTDKASDVSTGGILK